MLQPTNRISISSISYASPFSGSFLQLLVILPLVFWRAEVVVDRAIAESLSSFFVISVLFARLNTPHLYICSQHDTLLQWPERAICLRWDLMAIPAILNGELSSSSEFFLVSVVVSTIVSGGYTLSSHRLCDDSSALNPFPELRYGIQFNHVKLQCGGPVT